MAKRRKESPYRALGDLIANWRSKTHDSALALYKDAVNKPFSFSYSSYADYERGVTLPSINQALEIADRFGESREAMAMAWARVQMPEELKRFFSPHPNTGVALPAATPSEKARIDEQKSVPPLSLENTWVLGPQERDLLLNHPWLIDTLLLLAIEYPDAIAEEDLGPPGAVEVLKPCLDQGRIVKTEVGYKLNDPFFYLPRTKDWQPVRKQNLLRATQNMMTDLSSSDFDAGTAFQDIVTRKLTKSEAKTLVQQLEIIKDTFFNTPPHGERQIYSFAAVLAPRRLKPRSGA